MQLGPSSPVCEQTYRNQFEKPFDPSYIRKAWQTPSTDQFGKKALNLLSHYASLANTKLTTENQAKQHWLSNKGESDKPFSMSNYKTMYNNTFNVISFFESGTLRAEVTDSAEFFRRYLPVAKNHPKV